MLNVKSLTLFKLKNWKKAGILTKVLRKIRALPDFILQPSVAFELDFNWNLVLYQMQVILGC